MESGPGQLMVEGETNAKNKGAEYNDFEKEKDSVDFTNNIIKDENGDKAPQQNELKNENIGEHLVGRNKENETSNNEDEVPKDKTSENDANIFNVPAKIVKPTNITPLPSSLFIPPPMSLTEVKRVIKKAISQNLSIQVLFNIVRRRLGSINYLIGQEGNKFFRLTHKFRGRDLLWKELKLIYKKDSAFLIPANSNSEPRGEVSLYYLGKGSGTLFRLYKGSKIDMSNLDDIKDLKILGDEEEGQFADDGDGQSGYDDSIDALPRKRGRHRKVSRLPPGWKSFQYSTKNKHRTGYHMRDDYIMLDGYGSGINRSYGNYNTSQDDEDVYGDIDDIGRNKQKYSDMSPLNELDEDNIGTNNGKTNSNIKRRYVRSRFLSFVEPIPELLLKRVEGDSEKDIDRFVVDKENESKNLKLENELKARSLIVSMEKKLNELKYFKAKQCELLLHYDNIVRRDEELLERIKNSLKDYIGMLSTDVAKGIVESSLKALDKDNDQFNYKKMMMVNEKVKLEKTIQETDRAITLYSDAIKNGRSCEEINSCFPILSTDQNISFQGLDNALDYIWIQNVLRKPMKTIFEMNLSMPLALNFPIASKRQYVMSLITKNGFLISLLTQKKEEENNNSLKEEKYQGNQDENKDKNEKDSCKDESDSENYDVEVMNRLSTKGERRSILIIDMKTNSKKEILILPNTSFIFIHESTNNLILGGHTLDYLYSISLEDVTNFAIKKDIKLEYFMDIGNISEDCNPYLESTSTGGYMIFNDKDMKLVYINLISRSKHILMEQSPVQTFISLSMLTIENILAVGRDDKGNLVVIKKDGILEIQKCKGLQPFVLFPSTYEGVDVREMKYLSTNCCLCKNIYLTDITNFFKLGGYNIIRVFNDIFIILDINECRWLTMRIQNLRVLVK